MTKGKYIHLGLWVMTMLFALSCTRSYPDIFYNPDDVPEENTESDPKVAIRPTFDRNSIAFMINSRGYGAFDNVYYPESYRTRYLNSQYYVLAYRKSHQDVPEYGKTNHNATMNSSDNKEKIHCLVSSSNPVNAEGHRGKPVRMVDTDGALFFLNENNDKDDYFETLYYNNDHEELGYYFIGYFFDDAELNEAKANQDSITCNISIDGSQDIMVGKAATVTKDFLEKEHEELNDKDLMVEKSKGGYSRLTAMRGLQPKIVMQHLLTRLKFYATPKDESANNISITELRIKHYRAAEINIAAADESKIGAVYPKGTQRWMTLCDPVTLDKEGNAIPGGAMKPVDVSWNTEKTKDEQKKSALGESLMLYPAECYDMEIVGVQRKLKYTKPEEHPGEKLYDEIPFTLPVTIKATDGPIFEGGTTYLVTIDVYGFNEIQVNVESAAWQQGGNINLDVEY